MFECRIACVYSDSNVAFWWGTVIKVISPRRDFLPSNSDSSTILKHPNLFCIWDISLKPPHFIVFHLAIISDHIKNVSNIQETRTNCARRQDFIGGSPMIICTALSIECLQIDFTNCQRYACTSFASNCSLLCISLVKQGQIVFTGYDI